MNDWLDILCSAIARQEGWFASDRTTIPAVRNNPGNLRFAHQANATRPDGSSVGNLQVEPIACFSSAVAGMCALYRDVLAKIAIGMSLRKLIYTHAPPSENFTAVYLQNVQKWTKISDLDKQLLELFTLNAPVEKSS